MDGIVSKSYGHENMDIDNGKQRMLFSIGRPVKIEEDCQFATFITNDTSSKCIRDFLRSMCLLDWFIVQR